MRKPMEELAKKIGEMKVMSKTKTERKERGRDNREMISNRIEIKTINKTYSKDKKGMGMKDEGTDSLCS